MITGKDIVSAARGWLGTPFLHQGRLKGKGCDCVGLAKGVAVELDIKVGDYLNYTRHPDPQLMLRLLRENLEEITVEEAKEGDLYYMYFVNDPTHIAIKTDKGIIHSHLRVGKVVEQSLNKVWMKRIVKAFRYPGVA